MKRVIKALLPLADIVLAAVVFPSAFILGLIRKAGVQRMPLCKQFLMLAGVFPIVNHYNEPLFDSRALTYPLNRKRNLPGIDWNTDEQLEILARFDFAAELDDMPSSKPAEMTFYMNNGSFESGDAEFLYNLIRLKKPARIFEIGSGNSTLMAIKAIHRNKKENPAYSCKHICIEPYERPWLEKTGVTVVREKVEGLDIAIFSELAEGDLLFIDSSHIIRPQGDVLFEYLELLPSLKTGVIVHIHDIFSPRDYPKEWVIDEVKFWNEQYLLEAFLSFNRDWKIIGALNYLHHNHYEQLRATCPYLTRDREPGSFYLQKLARQPEAAARHHAGKRFLLSTSAGEMQPHSHPDSHRGSTGFLREVMSTASNTLTM